MLEEFVSLLVLSVFLVVFSTLVNAPLRELANPNLTPNPSKAPWYFLGLQELLRYWHPMIAGVIIPTLILVGLMAVPYVDRNPSTKPGDRKLAITLFTMLFMFGATLTIVGSFLRGPGFNWTWPWSQGLFFEL
jgi:quinol-cytochrome oxidoreductase complex cytochrome b subunit